MAGQFLPKNYCEALIFSLWTTWEQLRFLCMEFYPWNISPLFFHDWCFWLINSSISILYFSNDFLMPFLLYAELHIVESFPIPEVLCLNSIALKCYSMSCYFIGKISPTPTFVGCSLTNPGLNDRDACLNIGPRTTFSRKH